MLDKPIAAYEGDLNGLAATKPSPGQKINPDSKAASDYAAYLESTHDNALGLVGGARKLYDYKTSFNGFAAELTPEQAEKLALTNLEIDATERLKRTWVHPGRLPTADAERLPVDRDEDVPRQDGRSTSDLLQGC